MKISPYVLRSYTNNILKILLSESWEFSSYLPISNLFLLKSRLLITYSVAALCLPTSTPHNSKQCNIHISKTERCYNVQSVWHYYFLWRQIYYKKFFTALVRLILLCRWYKQNLELFSIGIVVDLIVCISISLSPHALRTST